MTVRARVLLVEGGAGLHPTRVTVSTARALHDAGYAVDVVTSNRASLAHASRAVERTTRTTIAEAREAVAEAREAGGYLCLLPTSDVVQRALELPGAAYADKLELHRHAASVDVPVPSTETFDGAETLRERAADLPYPVLLKPSVGKPAIHAEGPSDVERFLTQVRGPGRLLAQPILAGPVRAVSGVAWHGRLVAVVHQVALRAWPSASGTTCAAVTTDPDPALETWAERLVADYDGIFQAQFLSGTLIDLNLRPYGSIALAVGAGANLPALLAASFAGTDEARGSTVRARAGVPYRWLEGDLRLLRGAMGHGNLGALRELRPRLRTVHGDPWTLRDPGPLWARIRSGVSGRRSR